MLSGRTSTAPDGEIPTAAQKAPSGSPTAAPIWNT
jgi:hypothetical protein